MKIKQKKTKHPQNQSKVEQLVNVNSNTTNYQTFSVYLIVHSMLKCGSECSQPDSEDFMTFGQFCVYASDLEEHYEKFR